MRTDGSNESVRVAGAEGEAEANPEPRPTGVGRRSRPRPRRRPSCRRRRPRNGWRRWRPSATSMKDRMLRIAAEFENWKKRARKEQTDAVSEARERVLQGHAGRGRQPRARGRDADGRQRQRRRRGGVEGRRAWCCASSSRSWSATRCSPFEATGQPFDPRVHEAISRVESAGDAVRLGGGRAAEGLPGGRAPAASGAGLGVGGQRQARHAAVGGLAACPPTTTRRWASTAARPRPRSRWPIASSRSGGTPIATPATRRPRSGSRSWRSPTPCCPTTTSGGHYDRFGAVDGQARSRARRRHRRRPSSSMRCSAICSGCSAGGRRRGRDLRYTLELDFEEAALGCEKELVFERPEDCRRARAPAPRGATPASSPARAAAARASSARRPGFSPAGATAWAAAAPGRCRASAARPARARAWSIASAATRCASRPARRAGRRSGCRARAAPGRRGGPPGDLHVIVRVRSHPFFTPRVDARRRRADDRGAAVARRGDAGRGDRRAGAGRPRAHARAARRRRRARMFRLRGKGFPRAAGARGDAHVRVVVETPATVSRRREGAAREAGRGADRRRAAAAAGLPRGGPAREAGR